MSKKKPVRKFYRKYQTLFLALFSFVVFVWAAVDVFSVDPSVMMDLFIGALLFLAIVILLSMLGFFVTVLVKKIGK